MPLGGEVGVPRACGLFQAGMAPWQATLRHPSVWALTENSYEWTRIRRAV